MRQGENHEISMVPCIHALFDIEMALLECSKDAVSRAIKTYFIKKELVFISEIETLKLRNKLA